MKGFKIPLNAVAEQTRIHPSYLSRALLAKATLSSDQLFRIGTMLKLSRAEIDFLLILRERDETGDRTYRDYLDGRIDEIKHAHLKLSRRLASSNDGTQVSDAGVAEYYQDALNAAVHMYLCIARFRKQPQLIAGKLGISSDRLQGILAVLHRVGLVASEGDQLVIRKRVIHLDAESHLSRRNHINWRLEAIQSLQCSESAATNYSLSSCFSCSEQLLPYIKERFKEFVAEAQKAIVDDEGVENVYFLNFDLRELSRS